MRDMFPDSLTLQGGCFTASSTLSLLKKPINVLYGRNGSGKSTIANAFRVLKDEAVGMSLTAQLGDVELSDDDKRKIYVFDDSFIRRNLLISESGLDAIVMLGEQVDLSQQIQSKEQELEDVRLQLAVLNAESEQQNDGTNNKSPKFWRNKLRDVLRSTWAANDRDLKANTVLTHITDSVVDGFVKMSPPSEDIAELKQSYSTEWKRFHAARKNQNRIALLPADWTLPVDLVYVKELLTFSLEKPMLSDREKKILELASGQMSEVQRKKDVFSNPDTDVCPYCYQPLTQEYKNDLCASIEKILNKEVEVFQRKLQYLMSLLVNVSYSPSQDAKTLFPDEWIHLEEALRVYNEDLKRIREYLQVRLDSIYQPVEVELQEDMIIRDLRALNDSKNALQVKISSHNQIVESLEATKNRLLSENTRIAYVENKTIIDQIISQDNAKATNASNIATINDKIKGIENDIRDLKSRLSRIEIACDFINEALSFIFFSKDRIKLAPQDGKYCITSNGEPVHPDKVSVGERNAIALCYFFANMFVGLRSEDRYTPERLIVIDDPVSSFDQGNRMGIISFLRWQISQIHNGNADSKCLVMTHDLMTAFDLCKLAKEISNKKAIWQELSGGVLKDHQEERERNEYLKLMYSVYDFAICQHPTEVEAMYIGNQIRRVVEAYSSFKFNAGFETQFRKQDFLQPIPERKRSFYENLMYRLVLNGESHTEERAYNLPPIEERFSKEELQITAKSVLMMLYYVDKLHLTSYLSEQQHLDTFEQWKLENFDQLES